MSIAPANVSGRLVSRPTTAAANDATSSSVNSRSLRPRIGVRRTPARPANAVPTAHDPAVTNVVLIPEISADRGESTVARVASPMGVDRSNTVSPMTTAAPPARIATWLALIDRSKMLRWKISAGSLTSP